MSNNEKVNILVDENEQPCLSDFGLSRIVEEATGSLFMTSNSQARGTTRWMAPELLLGQEKRLNPSTDVYAYAMTVLVSPSSISASSSTEDILYIGSVNRPHPILPPPQRALRPNGARH